MMTQLDREACIPAAWRAVDMAANTTCSQACLNLDRSPHPGLFAFPDTMASPPPVEDQARLLEDALAVVRQQTMLMRRCLETPGKLMDALKCRYAPQWLRTAADEMARC
jgi:hypothetical protein